MFLNPTQTAPGPRRYYHAVFNLRGIVIHLCDGKNSNKAIRVGPVSQTIKVFGEIRSDAPR
jgi:hypothetical protein